jgi:hypothetical protein
VYAAGFCAELERQGYASQPASELAQLMAHVSRWLDGQGLMPEELTEEVADRPAPEEPLDCAAIRQHGQVDLALIHQFQPPRGVGELGNEPC